MAKIGVHLRNLSQKTAIY